MLGMDASWVSLHAHRLALSLFGTFIGWLGARLTGSDTLPSSFRWLAEKSRQQLNQPPF